MNQYKNFLSIIILLILFSFSSGECMSEKDVVYQKSISNSSKALEKKFGLHCCGTGARFKDKIEMIAISFQLRREVTLSQARNCLINVMDEYLSLLNSYGFLVPFMSQYPFTKENIEVTVYFSTNDMSDVDKPYIGIAGWANNEFSFFLGNKGDYSKPREIIYETYSEALEKAGLGQPSSTKSQDSEV